MSCKGYMGYMGYMGYKVTRLQGYKGCRGYKGCISHRGAGIHVTHVTIQPELRSGMGTAPAPGAVFRALAENPGAQESSGRRFQLHAQTAGREARPATPGAGVLPSFGVRVKMKRERTRLTPPSPRCGGLSCCSSPPDSSPGPSSAAGCLSRPSHAPRLRNAPSAAV